MTLLILYIANSLYIDTLQEFRELAMYENLPLQGEKIGRGLIISGTYPRNCPSMGWNGRAFLLNLEE